MGIKPFTLSTDDYFMARSDPRHPRDEQGELDFENINAIDLTTFNDQ